MNSAPVMENLSSSLWISKSLNTVSTSNDGLCAFANFFEKRQVKEPSTATLITLWRQGAVASWLVRSSPDRVVRVRAPAGDIVLCSWARHLTLTVPLSTKVYKWVPAICWGNLHVTNCGKVTCDGLPSGRGGVEILLAAPCYKNRDKLRQLWVSHGSKASLCQQKCQRMAKNVITLLMFEISK